MSELFTDDAPDTKAIAVREEPATNPMSLLAAAVERGLSTEQLTALTDLHERWQANRAKAAFAKAMNDCQTEMPCVVRDKENPKTKSLFARLETVNSIAKPVYSKHGFALSFSEEDCPRDTWKRTVCLVRHDEGHTERHIIDLPVDGIGPQGNPIGGMNAVQGAISTGSYAQRVLICRIFNLTIADTDLDGNRPAYENPGESRTQSRPPPRGQRNQPDGPPPEINANQLAHVVAHWKAKNLDPDGNTDRQAEAFKAWARRTTARTESFNPKKPSEWTKQDYKLCCDALGIEVLDA